MYLNTRVAIWAVAAISVVYLAWPFLSIGYSPIKHFISEAWYWTPGLFLALAYASSLRPLNKWWRHVLLVVLTYAASLAATAIGMAVHPFEGLVPYDGFVLASAFGAFAFALILRFAAGLRFIGPRISLRLVLAASVATALASYAFVSVPHHGKADLNLYLTVPWWVAVTAVVVASAPRGETPSNKPLHPTLRASAQRR